MTLRAIAAFTILWMLFFRTNNTIQKTHSERVRRTECVIFEEAQNPYLKVVVGIITSLITLMDNGWDRCTFKITFVDNKCFEI